MKIVLTIMILAIAAIAILSLIRFQDDGRVRKIWQACQTKPTGSVFTPEQIADLPEPVRRYFSHAIAPETPLAEYVELKMSGNFRQHPHAKWLPMQASQIISTLPGFVWRGTVGRGLGKFSGADYFDGSQGGVKISWWGLIPLVNAQNQNIDRSSRGRLGGEYSIWLPSALLPQNGVTWQAIAEDKIRADFKLDRQPLSITLAIDADGRVRKISFPRWCDRTKDRSWQYLPFGGEVRAEQTFDGYTIPTAVNAGWWFDSKNYFEFFQTKIEKAQFY